MKTIWIAILAGLLLAGCGALQTSKDNSNSAPASAESEKPKVGDIVVAKWALGAFYEGKIDKIDSTKYTIAWLDKSSPTLVDSIDVYSIPKAGSKVDVKAGDIVLAKIGGGTMWSGAEVTSIEGSVYKVKVSASATSANVPAEGIIKVSAATAADLKDKAGATDFLKEAQKGKISVPADYKPKKGDKVVAEWTTNTWYSGTIDNVSGSNIYVAWDDNTKPSAVNSSKVAPLPSANSKDIPKANQYILIKPDSGSKWEYAQAMAINGTSVEAKLPNNQTKTVKAGGFVLLN
jgi:hypothetical protein